MPAVARAPGDPVFTVHGTCSFPSTIATLTGSANVFVNNISIHRLTDLNTPHRHCPPPGGRVYSTPLVTGSPNVFANNLNVGRIGDVYSCGARIIGGSPNVFANG